MSQLVYVVATMDTKGREAAYVAECLRAAGIPVVTVDVGTVGPAVVAADVEPATVAGCHATAAGRTAALTPGDRGRAITAMSEALECYLRREHSSGLVAGVIGIGGSGGTALISPALQALPIGVPKVMVSTVASGNTAAYVGFSDITLVHSVVDVAGLNAVSRRVLGNAAHAMAGMVQHVLPDFRGKPTLGMTMFGVTTPCVTAVRQALEAEGFDCLVFHATGTGGRAMEALVEAGLIQGVLDITTTEVADLVVGGILPAGPDRFDAILAARVPFVLSLGALDMVNFGALATVPERFRSRRLHAHNAQVTLMRTTPDENQHCARWIASKLNRALAPFRLLIPTSGVSTIDAPGQPFYDPVADAALFDELESAIQPAPGRSIERLPLHINDPDFAEAIVGAFLGLHRAAVPARAEGPQSRSGPERSSPSRVAENA
jgi:uncharacterized protein (UPF0261 family)